MQQVPRLSDEMGQTLAQSVTMKEVEDALDAIHPYKSLGPDDFQGVFFKFYWHIIRQDVFSLISQAFSTGFFDPAIAETLHCFDS